MNFGKFLTLAVFLPVLAFGQAITATVVGTVTDPSGAVVPNARVAIRSQQTNLVRETTTTSAGAYEFQYLQVGAYTLVVDAAGFQHTEVSAFSLSVDQVARVDLKLAIGQASDRIQVKAAAVGLQTENATVGTVIDSRQVVDLPLNGRSFVQLAQLTPGVNPGTPGSISVRRLRGSLGQAVGMSANGARDTQNRYYYDGIEAMDYDSYGFSFSPSIDAIQEFKVQSSTYSAEVGGAPGGQVNLTTRGGSNALHGTLWEFNRNDAFTALNAFQPRVPGAKPPRLNRNQFGANVGGPVELPKLYHGRDHTFFFFNWESGRQISGTFGNQVQVAPAALRTGNFSGSRSIISDPTTRQPFVGNIIPTDRIASYASKFLTQFVPQPNLSLTGINYISPALSAPVNQDQYTTRIDQAISSRDNLSASYVFNTQADNTVPTFVFDSRGNRARAQNLSLVEVHVFSPSVVNEFRAGWNRFFEHEFFGSTGNPQYDVANIIGIGGVSKNPLDYGAPTFTAGYAMPTTQTNGPRDRLNQIWQLADNVSLRHGKHSIKAGILFARRNINFDQTNNPRGTFTYSGNVTAIGSSPTIDNQFAEFLLGLATSAQLSPARRQSRLNNWSQAYYVQDDWKVTRSLTLNFGMRYEFLPPYTSKAQSVNFTSNGFVVNGRIFAGFPNIPDTPGYPHSLVYGDKKDWGPRFGFAWNAPGIRDLVVRGGYGIYYSPEVSNIFTNMTANEPIVARYSFTGTPTTPIAVQTAFLSSKNPDVISTGNGLDPNFKNAYTQQWNFTIQKKLPRQVYLDAGYVGSKGTRIPIIYDANRPINIIPAGQPIPALASRRPFLGWDTVNIDKAVGNSTYHSLQTKVERRINPGLSILGAYTWSKVLTNADSSGNIGAGSYNGPYQDYMNLAGARTYALFDIAQRLSTAVIWDVPVFRSSSQRMLRTLLGGWQLSTIVTEQTGFAAAPTGGSDTTGTGITSRLNAVLGQNPMLPRDQRTRARWFNTAAFAPPVNGSWGNAARNPLHLPGLNQVDASASKNFALTEHHRIQFRADFFNFFNHVNLGAPGLNIRDPANFGRVTSTSQTAGMPGDARVIQFALKYIF